MKTSVIVKRVPDGKNEAGPAPKHERFDVWYEWKHFMAIVNPLWCFIHNIVQPEIDRLQTELADAWRTIENLKTVEVTTTSDGLPAETSGYIRVDTMTAPVMSWDDAVWEAMIALREGVADYPPNYDIAVRVVNRLGFKKGYGK